MELTPRPDTTGPMRSRLLAIALAGLLGLAACGGGGDDEAQDPSSTTTTEADESSTETDDGRTGRRAIGGSGVIATDSGDDADAPAEPAETYSPTHNAEPSESVIPMFEG